MTINNSKPKRTPGEVFSPYKMFYGSFLPNYIMRYKGLPAGAKLTWARLAQFAGKDTHAYPSLNTLAKEIGSDRRTVIKYLNKLEKKGFLKIVRTKILPNLNTTNVYYFLWHEIFESNENNLPRGSDHNVQGVVTNMSGGSDDNVPGVVIKMHQGGVQNVPGGSDFYSPKENNKEENHLRDITENNNNDSASSNKDNNTEVNNDEVSNSIKENKDIVTVNKTSSFSSDKKTSTDNLHNQDTGSLSQNKYLSESLEHKFSYRLKEIVQKNFPEDSPPDDKKIMKWMDVFHEILNDDKRSTDDIDTILKVLEKECEWFWKNQISSPDTLRGKTQKGNDRYAMILKNAKEEMRKMRAKNAGKTFKVTKCSYCGKEGHTATFETDCPNHTN